MRRKIFFGLLLLLVLPVLGSGAVNAPSLGDTTVYVTKSGAKYHRDGCHYLKKSSIPLALKDAVKRYSPCSVCKPPTLDDKEESPELAAAPGAAELPAAALRSTTVPAAQAADSSTEEDIAVYFSPGGGLTEAVVKELDGAKKSILVQAYSFTSTPIAKALLEAHKRGVAITVILDKAQHTANYSEADFVANAEIPCYIDAKHAIAHNKIILIDGQTIITGSANFTKAAGTVNAENLLVIRDHPKLFARYEENFRVHLGHSERYAGRQ